MNIPIQNVYYMLAYAYNHFQDGLFDFVGAEEANTPQEYLALVLSRGTAYLLRRGIDKVYREQAEYLSVIRGRVNFQKYSREYNYKNPSIPCLYDELSVDSLHNQILYNSLYNLINTSGIDSKIKDEIIKTYKRFPPATMLKIRSEHFSQVKIHRNNYYYKFLIGICRLIFENLLPDKNLQAIYSMKDFRKDGAIMHKLFEEFIYFFFKFNLQGEKVHRPEVPWGLNNREVRNIKMLPRMKTDIVIERDDEVCIIDAKYYSKPLNQNGKFHSSNLYQINSYVQNTSYNRPQKKVKGMLIYASVGENFKFEYNILGHSISVVTLDLNVSWDKIKEQLYSLKSQFFL